MEPATALRFATAARALSMEARRLGLAAPAFRSPPRAAGVDRALRRRGGWPVVSVRVRDRYWPAVAADMVEGVIAANGLSGRVAEEVRGQLWQVIGTQAPAPVRAA
jgi:hypothetical protein